MKTRTLFSTAYVNDEHSCAMSVVLTDWGAVGVAAKSRPKHSFHCQTRLPWLLWGVWLQAGITTKVIHQGMGILQDKDPLHSHSKPAGLCYWCKREEGWLHCLVWLRCSKAGLSTDHSSLKDACWIFCICLILIPKLFFPTLCLPYRLSFKIAQPEYWNFSSERVFKFFLFFFLHWGKL